MVSCTLYLVSFSSGKHCRFLQHGHKKKSHLNRLKVPSTVYGRTKLTLQTTCLYCCRYPYYFPDGFLSVHLPALEHRAVHVSTRARMGPAKSSDNLWQRHMFPTLNPASRSEVRRLRTKIEAEVGTLAQGQQDDLFLFSEKVMRIYNNAMQELAR